MVNARSGRLRHIFRDPSRYDFFLAPTLIRSLSQAPVEAEPLMKRWAKGQAEHESKILAADRETNTVTFRRLDGLFRSHPDRIVGNVLDVGGGWGMLRQWWQPTSDDDLYIVHDPGIRRILAGPRLEHREMYAAGFSKPVTFVIGFGEELDYQTGVFDTIVAKEMLDHSINPERVMQGVREILRPGGSVMVMNHLSHGNGAALGNRARRLLSKGPKHAWKQIVRKARFGLRDHHLRMFDEPSLRDLMHSSGFKLDHDFVLDPGDGLPPQYVGFWESGTMEERRPALLQCEA